jgi:site-specific DNA recombinase
VRPWLGYRRVSRVGDRAERLISPELQAVRIESYAASKRLALELLPPELDVSGKEVSRPILDLALRRIESGEAAGIIVAQLDRLSRAGIVATHHLIQRIESAGGKLIAVAESFDDSTPEGRMGRNVMLALGEMQLDRYRAQFAAAKEQAVRRGIWPVPRAPRGYVIGSERHLVPGPQAPRVLRAFESRAGGNAWSVVAQILGSGVSGAGKTIRNRAYLGEINLGLLRNPSAHKPLVSRALWEAAQIAHPRPARGAHGPALLSGLVRCASCGYSMTPDGNRKGWRGYRCHPRKAGGVCRAPAMISARVLDPFVEAVVLHHAKEMTYSLDAPAEVDEREKALENAEHELAAYQRAQRVSGLGEEHFVAGMRSRVEAVEDARRELANARSVTQLPESGLVVELWPTLSVLEKRHALRGSLSAVEVRRGRGHVSLRTRLLDRSGTPIVVPEHLREGAGKV